jgi:hypothetical protein
MEIQPRLIFEEKFAQIHLDLVKAVTDLGCIVENMQMDREQIRIPPRYSIFIFSPAEIDSLENVEEFVKMMCDFVESHAFHMVIMQELPFPTSDSRIQERNGTIVTRLLLEANCGIIPSRSVADTALCLRSLAKREQIEDIAPNLHRIKPKTATLREQQQTVIEGLVNIGPKKAAELLQHFPHPFAIFDAILKHPEKILAIKGFGPKFIEKNQKLLRTAF